MSQGMWSRMYGFPCRWCGGLHMDRTPDLRNPTRALLRCRDCKTEWLANPAQGFAILRITMLPKAGLKALPEYAMKFVPTRLGGQLAIPMCDV